MSRELSFVALTSGDVGAGTVLEYLLRTTRINLVGVYFDTMTEFAPRPPGAGRPETERIGQWEKLRYHLALLRRLPRSHGLRLLERVSGWPVLRVLRALERVHRSLPGLVSGVPVPRAPWGGQLLHRLEEVARRHGIPLVRTPSLNNPATVAALHAAQADVFLGLGTRILSARVLEAARVGVLNAHSSLLPEYRGGTTEFWQLAAGEATTGVTIHWMASRVDEGPICLRRSWPVPTGADHHKLRLLSLYNRLDAWREVVDRLSGGESLREPQGEARTPTFRHPSLRQQYEFYCLGRSPLARDVGPAPSPLPSVAPAATGSQAEC